MDIIKDINYITVILIGLFAVPVLVGVASPFSSDRMQRSLGSLLSSLTFLAAIILAVYLTGWFFSGDESRLKTALFNAIPPLQVLAANGDNWVSIIAALILTALIGGLLHLITLPVYRLVIVPLTDRFSAAMRRMSGGFRRVVGGVWELPKAVLLVVFFSLLLNIYAGYAGSSAVGRKIKSSSVYQYISAAVLDPLLSSPLAKKIPVLLDETFKEAAQSLEERNFRLVRYFNGMTLNEAVRSNADIDAAAKDIAGNETDEREKARLLYGWITENISYDVEKAAAVTEDPSGVSSGAVVAYETGTGICFDYACLYIAMCRAVDVKVRFVTGLGYSGAAWGDHAWNQAYDAAGGKWLNVDTTFGSSGKNYFDREDFDADHKYAVVQEEW